MRPYINGKDVRMEELFEGQNLKLDALKQSIEEGNKEVAGAIDKLNVAIVTELRAQRGDLIAPATGKKQVPLVAVLVMFAGLFIFMFLDSIKNSNKTLSVDRNGLHINDSQNK